MKLFFDKWSYFPCLYGMFSDEDREVCVFTRPLKQALGPFSFFGILNSIIHEVGHFFGYKLSSETFHIIFDRADKTSKILSYLERRRKWQVGLIQNRKR